MAHFKAHFVVPILLMMLLALEATPMPSTHYYPTPPTPNPATPIPSTPDLTPPSLQLPPHQRQHLLLHIGLCLQSLLPGLQLKLGLHLLRNLQLPLGLRLPRLLQCLQLPLDLYLQHPHHPLLQLLLLQHHLLIPLLLLQRQKPKQQQPDAETTTISSVKTIQHMEHVFPKSCPGVCEVDCVTCKPVCRCDKPGAVRQYPHFIGGDGITFYFHGKKDKDFYLVSDSDLHINAHFIGYVTRFNMGAKMPVMGDYRDFQTFGLFTTDCAVAQFNDGIDNEELVSVLALPSMRCGSGINGKGVVCKR
ncbi:hypothetical protein Ddye_003580 [Dipteronia dyeriana]|uniref:Uncharacterized protein n=1 Tax=Dipteronia dyeriana TaxID=168575 RepID=A0AAE0CVH6_9ROSI|nr:hypothetical protein Ddye_003580 [Dipteronia dyeriana]